MVPEEPKKIVHVTATTHEERCARNGNIQPLTNTYVPKERDTSTSQNKGFLDKVALAPCCRSLSTQVPPFRLGMPWSQVPSCTFNQISWSQLQYPRLRMKPLHFRIGSNEELRNKVASQKKKKTALTKITTNREKDTQCDHKLATK